MLSVTGLSENTLYNWRVRAKINNVFGSWSEIWKFTTIGKIPYLLSPTNYSIVNPKNLLLKWYKTAFSINYRVQVSTDSLFNSSVIDSNNLTDSVLTVNLAYNTKYFWRVGAKVDNEIFWSAYRSFLTKPPSNTSFPLAIGNKWYYRAGSTRNKFYYGIVKEITDTLNNGFREIISKSYYEDSIHISKEYWAYIDGKFYVNKVPNINYAFIYFDDSITDGTFIGFSYLKLIDYKLFNISETAQEYYEFRYSPTAWISYLIITLPSIGIVETKEKIMDVGKFYTDSTYLVGMYKNDEVLGDTVLKNNYRTSNLLLPVNGATNIPNSILFKWSNAYQPNFFRFQISTDSTFENIIHDYSDLSDTLINIDSLNYNTKYYWRIVTLSKDNNKYLSNIFWFITVNPVLISNPEIPLNNSTEISLTPTLKWSIVEHVASYRVQISNDSVFNKIIFDFRGMKDTSLTIESLDYLSTYYWRIKTVSSTGYEYMSPTWKFTTISGPKKFQFYQNFPNPFNLVTEIKYDLIKSEFITLKIYNVLGKEISTLVNELKPAGSYIVKFNGNNLSSGIYFYKLQTENYSSIKKMVLIK